MFWTGLKSRWWKCAMLPLAARLLCLFYASLSRRSPCPPSLSHPVGVTTLTQPFHAHTISALLLKPGQGRRGRRDTDEGWKPAQCRVPDPCWNTGANECSQKSECVAWAAAAPKYTYTQPHPSGHSCFIHKGLSKINKADLGQFLTITHENSTSMCSLCVSLFSYSAWEWCNSLTTVGRNDSRLLRAHSH